MRRALVISLALALAACGLAVAKKKHHGGKQPRGPYPTLGSCQVFPKFAGPANAPSAGDESAWNQDISQAPLDPNSAGYIAYINAHGDDSVHPDFGSPREYGFPYTVVGKKQKKTKVNFTAYGDESTHGTYRVPLGALVEGGQSSDGDRHVLAIDRKRCKLYELYRAFAQKRPRPHWNADSAVIWDLRSPALRTQGFTSADAAGLPIFPGLARYDEAAGGGIHHALRVTVSSTRDAWVNPASHCAGSTSSAGAPPMGLRLRLGAGYDISGFTGPARAIAVALKQYGLIVADNGSNWFVSGTSDRRWPDENLDQLKSIPGSAFEVVQSAAPIHSC
ncbi:MAG TPA: hypothetical protein VHR38_05030 [Solirubrobacterales bacterium]|nr:hypothetical protein [Solirubrobacterales bacterium]